MGRCLVNFMSMVGDSKNVEDSSSVLLLSCVSNLIDSKKGEYIVEFR